LGHAFAGLISGSKGPYGNVYPYPEFLTDVGFARGPEYGGELWRQHKDLGEDNITRHREAFADMFLGYVFNVWDNDIWGQRRDIYMTTNMAEWVK
jgi:hypothetical protein